MTSIIYHRISKSVFIISVVLLVISIGSAISVIITEFPLKLSLNHQGFENFVDYFSFSIKALTATLATFAIWLTLERLSQTERQIDAFTDSNKFNNYLKHQQEFIDSLKDTQIFNLLKKEEDIAPRVYLAPWYKTYYADNYLNFKPHMKESVKQEIDVFFHKLIISQMSKLDCTLENVPIEEIIELSKFANRHVEELVAPLTEKIVFRLKAKSGVKGFMNPPSSLQLVINRFECLHKIFWTIAFYKTLLTFDGEIIADNPFTDNYEKYTIRLGVLINAT